MCHAPPETRSSNRCPQPRKRVRARAQLKRGRIDPASAHLGTVVLSWTARRRRHRPGHVYVGRAAVVGPGHRRCRLRWRNVCPRACAPGCGGWEDGIPTPRRFPRRHCRRHSRQPPIAPENQLGDHPRQNPPPVRPSASESPRTPWRRYDEWGYDDAWSSGLSSTCAAMACGFPRLRLILRRPSDPPLSCFCSELLGRCGRGVPCRYRSLEPTFACGLTRGP